MALTNPLKRKLQAGGRAFGAWLASGSATITELLARCGYDFLVLDQEHGPGETEALIASLQAAQGTGCELVVRVRWNDQALLKRALDAGARSIMVPMVEDAAEAEAAVAACRYPPRGRRGFGGVVRAARFGLEEDYAAKAHERLLLLTQIESATAAYNAGAIAAVEGVDVVFIGVNDLSGSIGRLGELDHPEVQALVAEVERAVPAAGKVLGTVPTPRRDPAALAAAGYGLVAASADISLLRDAALAELERVRPHFDCPVAVRAG